MFLKCVTRFEEVEANVSKTSPFLSLRSVYLFASFRKKKMLNFYLTTVFILEFVAASKSSCFLVFCGKSVLRLALFHSKYIEHRKIAKIRTQLRVNFPLLRFSATT